MNTDDNTKAQSQRETPRHSTVQEEQVDDDDDGVSAQRQGDDEKKAEQEATPSDGNKLPEPKAPDHGQSERVVYKKDVKVKRDHSTAADRPGAVAVPGTGTTETTRTVREPGGIVPQMNQLREPSEVAGPSPATKENPAIAPFVDSQIKGKERAEQERSQASDAAVQSVAVAVEKPPFQPGAVAVQGAIQNTKLRTGPQQPVAVAVQGPDAAVRSKGYTETAAAVRKKEFAGRSSQPREPATLAGRATIAMKGSEDQDIESGLLVPASGMVDEKRVNVRAGGVSSGDDVRPGAVAVEPGTTITTQNAEMSAFPAPTTHTSSPSILTSKSAIANRSTAAAHGKTGSNGATGVTDGALPVSDKYLDKDESGALPEAAGDSRVGAVAVPAAAGMETLNRAHSSSYMETAVNEDNDINAVPRAMLVTADAANEVDREALFYEARVAAEADVRQQMITKVVNAEIVDVSKLNQQRRRRGFLQFSLLALVVIVAAVVGGVVGSQSGGGSKALPSMAPSMSASPSAAPTETPNNDFCDEAFDVTGDDTVVVESLRNTTVEIRRTCSSGDEIEQRGRWYEYSGNGLGLTVEMQSAVEDATALEVLVGSCEELQCTETAASSNTTLNFVTAENTAYLIHVYSRLDAMFEPSEDYNLKVSDNSGCGNAYPVDTDTQMLYLGSTAAAAVSDLAPSCGSATVGVSPGVWFEVAGDGMNIEASTCGGASFDTQISVYTGGCGSLECVVGNNDFCEGRSSVLWLSRVSIPAAFLVQWRISFFWLLSTVIGCHGISSE
jgi:hypothetical protein